MLGKEKENERSVAQLISALEAQGMSIWVDGEEVRYRGPAQLHETSTMAGLRQHKAEAVRYLRARQTRRTLPPLAPVSRLEPIPLSATQLAWYDLGYRGRILPDLCSFYFPVPGPPQLKTGQGAFDRIVERHETLRTVYREGPAGPEQIILERLPVSIDVVDIGGIPKERRRDVLTNDLLPAHREMRVDLSTGPVLRARVFVADEPVHILSLAGNRIALDASSWQILLAELAIAAAAERSGIEPNLPPIRLQYADYAIWETANIGGPFQKESQSYWDQRLEGLEPLQLSTTSSRDVPPYERKTFPVRFTQDQVTSMRSLSLSLAVSLPVILGAAVNALLAQWTGQKSVVSGLLLHGRPPGAESLIGCFSRTRPLVTDHSIRQSFTELISQARLSYQIAGNPLHTISRDLLLKFGLHRIVLNILQLPGGQKTGVDVSSDDASETVQPTSNPDFFSDLAVTLVESPSGFSGRIDYAPAYIERKRAAWLARTLPDFLRAACAAPSQPIAQMSVD